VLLAASAYEIVLAVHVVAVVIAFGVTFAYPIMFAVGARSDPSTLPTLHRVEYTIERLLINPATVVVLAAGIFLASDGHRWSEFFVQWGLAAIVVIGALVGAVMIPTAKRAEQLAHQAVAAASGGAPEFGDEYRVAVQRLSVVGSLLSTLVVVTVVLMVIKP
jgi:Predicted integral membrane protein (DUF2269)